ncbi:hypothetical protein [Tenggerimyces flavus]|uniref:Uncharacterized protein n=1 Tax=Tenggerimyces flavus TaxID=1708749 RepID=A0ABV7YRB7_9ACTN|nr:hypothetical protein [Tenggerimyces flavus]MBM7786359.1 hypothetical protein [Tenggerimyces flavus]
MVSPLFTRLIDDAAMFPPGNAPLGEAVPGHAAHRGAAYGELVGPFLVSDQRLPDLQPPTDLAIGVIVSGGAGAIGPALTWASRMANVQVKAVEAALRDEPELARNARRVTMAYDQARQDGTLQEHAHAYIEVPRLYGWQDALDVLAETGDRAKLRTGGDSPPTEQELADFIEACLDRELPFKLTAGLHHAARNTTDSTEQHGFLNVLLATRHALDGTNPTEVLAERDGTVLAEQAEALDDAAAKSTRRWFTSFGSCSIAEPVDDLRTLGLLR